MANIYEGHRTQNGDIRDLHVLVSVDMAQMSPRLSDLLKSHSTLELAAQAIYLACRDGVPATTISCSNKQIADRMTISLIGDKMSIKLPISFLEKHWSGDYSNTEHVCRLLTDTLGYLAELCNNAAKEAEAAAYITKGLLFKEAVKLATSKVA